MRHNTSYIENSHLMLTCFGNRAHAWIGSNNNEQESSAPLLGEKGMRLKMQSYAHIPGNKPTEYYRFASEYRCLGLYCNPKHTGDKTKRNSRALYIYICHEKLHKTI